MKKALFYRNMKGNSVQCTLCPHFCIVKDGEYGNCGVRKNVHGILYSTTYGKPCATAVDPIEKKPLFHFLPGALAYSIATVGCNFHCKNCQNWQISQAKLEDYPYEEKAPQEVVREAISAGCKIIAYTYTEPAVFFEYVLDIAKIAKRKGLKNILVTNGFTNPEPIREWAKFIDAANIDMKSMDDSFYRKICSARLKPVQESLKLYKELGVWIEVTNLIIPTLNDSRTILKKLCSWVKGELGDSTPLHFSRFFPYYKLKNIPITPKEKLLEAYDLAQKAGLKYVYLGNLWADKEENTYCPNCGRPVVERSAFSVIKNHLKDGVCSCGYRMPGVWK